MEGESGEQGSEGEPQQTAEQSPPERAPVRSTEPPQRENTTQPARNKPKKRYWRDERWRNPQVIVNGILAFVALIAAIIYFCQLQQMRKSTKAATQAAQAAKDSINLARENVHLDQRAWVTVTVAQLDKPLAPNEKPRVNLTLKNSGKTPALKVHAFSEVYIAPMPRIVRYDADDTTSEAIISPSAEPTVSREAVDPIRDQAQIDSVLHKESAVFATGVITYCDIFRQRHRTEFCLHLNGTGINGTPGRSGIFLNACGRGNTVDEKPEPCPEK